MIANQCSEDEIVDIKLQLQHLSSNLSPQKAQYQPDIQNTSIHIDAPTCTIESNNTISKSIQRDVYKGSLSFSADSTQWAKSLQDEPSASPASTVLKDAINAVSTDEDNARLTPDVEPLRHERIARERPLPSADSVLSVLNAVKGQ